MYLYKYGSGSGICSVWVGDGEALMLGLVGRLL